MSSGAQSGLEQSCVCILIEDDTSNQANPLSYCVSWDLVHEQAVMLRLGLNAGNIYPKLAEHMGAFCARTLYNTSLLALSSTQHRWGQYCSRGLGECTPAMCSSSCLGRRLAVCARIVLQNIGCKTLHATHDSMQLDMLHRELVARFANNEMCRITEALIFREPYSAAEAKNKWTAPHLDSDVAALQADEEARAAAGRLQVSTAI